MKRLIRLIGLIIAIILVLLIVTKITDYNSLVSQNTRLLEDVLSEDITSGKDSADGNVKDLITLEYDKVYFFGPYQSVEEMEKQIGFKYSKLAPALTERSINALFVKDDNIIAYLHGSTNNTGYYINLSGSEYTKAQMDSMTYKMEEIEVGNSYGNPKTCMNYNFTD